jgi:acryloyl-coenzyme A reductase
VEFDPSLGEMPMRAVVLRDFGAPEALRVEDVPEPSYGPDQMLVEVGACGVCGHDVLARRGELGTPLPAVLGHEIAGRVRKVGSEVTRLRPGDRVALVQREPCGTCFSCSIGRPNLCRSGPGFYGEDRPGGYSELVTASERNAVLLPPSVSESAGSILSCAVGTGWHALQRLEVKTGEVVVVTAASGGVGVHAVQLARHLGATVVAVTRSTDKVEPLRGLGADHVVNLSHDRDLRSQVRGLTGRLADVVLELAGPPTFGASLRALGPRGRMALIGNVEPRDVAMQPGLMILKELSIVGCAHGTRDDLATVVDLVEAGHVRPVIAHEHPLANASLAHASQGSMGRHVLVPSLG